MSTTPLILGHRGASAFVPENTLAAFSRALSDGADGIEFDVRLSADDVPVVIHDASLKRTGMLDRRVCEMTSSELQETDVGSWFGKRGQNNVSDGPATSFAAHKLPTLAQVFELFQTNRGLLYLEMKGDADKETVLAAKVVESIRNSQIRDRIVVESFDLAAIAEVKRIDPGIRTAALFEPGLRQPLSTFRPLKVVDVARHYAADEIALHHSLTSTRMLEKAHEAGLDIVVWTVDDLKWIERARAHGIKALIANDPGRMVRWRDDS